MINRITNISERQIALVAGCGLLIMTLFYLFADFFCFPETYCAGRGNNNSQ